VLTKNNNSLYAVYGGKNMNALDFIKKYGVEKNSDGKYEYSGSLDLRGTGITALPDGLTIGGSLDLSGTGITNTTNFTRVCDGHFFDWGKYCMVDGIFTEIVAKKSKVYRVKKIGAKEIMYLVTDGHGKWAHGDTIDDARESLIYKIGERDMSKYSQMTAENILTFAEMVECYRVITGACAAGTRGFVESVGAKKRSYSIGEVIKMTVGQFGHDNFKRFFEVK
jgi:hypothetical protein